MKKINTGEELNQIARFLFGEAASKWYIAAVLELTAGVLSGVFAVIERPDLLVMAGAVLGTTLILIAYLLRLWSVQQYGTAETMRRQSVFTEALGWGVSKTQMSKWRQDAGKSTLEKIQRIPRDPNYYTTSKGVGYQKLAEMTLESAFYTRHLYGKIRLWVWIVFLVSAGIVTLVVAVTITGTFPNQVELIVAKVLFAVIPTALAIDLLGWAIKLSQMVREICDIEESLERMLNDNSADLPQVLRIVSEYNCRVVTGIPIHDRIFQRWHDEIKIMWQKRWN